MRRGITVAAAVISSVALIGIGAGCGGTDSSAASTPADATTIANNAPQTDSEGKTVPAPDAAATADSGQAAPSAPEAGTSVASSGDVAAGKTVFEANCQGCHPAGGTTAGVGPKLQGMGLSLDKIKYQITNGGGGMPAGLISGTDLDNAAAYVESIQK